MSDLVYIPDHRSIAVSRLLAQYRGKPRIEAMVRALAAGMQAVEDDAFGVLVSSTLDTAANADLDQWGAFVGEDRVGLDDDTYRLFISARILANYSRGTRDELIRILQLVTAPSDVVYVDIYPACFQLIVRRSTGFMDDAHARRVGQLMRAIKPAGVCMFLVEAAPGYFGFLPDPAALGFDLGVYGRVI